MKYEYKAVALGPHDYSLTEENILNLNKWFDEGWEFVSTVSSGGKTYPATGAVLRRPVETKTENLLP